MFPQVTMPAMLTINQAAASFNVGRGRIRTAVQTGELRSYMPNGRDYLVKADEVQKWIERFPYSPIIRENKRREIK